jgi:hypothetical protein
MIDTLHTYDTLKEGEIPDRQARAMTLAIKNAESDIALDVKTVIDRRFEEFYRYLDSKFATKVELAQTETRLVRWMFLFWVGQLAVMAGLIKLMH